MIYKFFNGLFLYQVQPSFFYLRQDVFTWLFMQTGLPQSLVNNHTGWLMFDVLFYSCPLIYLLIYKLNTNIASVVAIIMVLVNWCYVQCYTLYPINSIEGHIGWLLFPVIFIPAKEKTFQLLFDGLRYFFLFFFASAAIWKIVQGGIFNFSEMSGILLYQHNQLITNSPAYWQTGFYLYLITHETLSYTLYFSATILEIAFVIGFFTKKYDYLLAALAIIFIVTDHLIMRIPYYEITPLLLTLILKYPENKRSYN